MKANYHALGALPPFALEAVDAECDCVGGLLSFWDFGVADDTAAVAALALQARGSEGDSDYEEEYKEGWAEKGESA